MRIPLSKIAFVALLYVIGVGFLAVGAIEVYLDLSHRRSIDFGWLIAGAIALAVAIYAHRLLRRETVVD